MAEQRLTEEHTAEKDAPCGSCGEPTSHRIILRGKHVPACLRHTNVWRTPSADYTCPTRCAEVNHPGTEHLEWLNADPACDDFKNSGDGWCDLCDRPWSEHVALPYHNDWGGPCTHRAAWEAVTTHTRTVNGIGPDHCEECSTAIGEWVPWPCPRVIPPASTALATDHEAEAAERGDGHGE